MRTKKHRIEVCKEIRKARIALGYSQDELAGYLEIPKRTLQSWEIGDRPPNGPSTMLIRVFLEEYRRGKVPENPNKRAA
jgi:DNA-binding transcriptional regulator YiaG